jgi:predicted membrane channel-forming protein YqfA (hemolysin III family)
VVSVTDSCGRILVFLDWNVSTQAKHKLYIYIYISVCLSGVYVVRQLSEELNESDFNAP